MNGLALADQLRMDIGSFVDPTTRSKLGQFMTPAPVASFMVGLFGDLPDQIRLLDAGAGFGSLTAAFVHEACMRARRPSSIHATAFEIDPALAKRLKGTMEACADESRRFGIDFAFRIIGDDYILHSAEPLIANQDRVGVFNCAILNPPYAKINTASALRRALRKLSIETSNLYTAFVAVALEQLSPGGQMVAITPRSFCNGTYFAPFRKRLLEGAAIEHIHVYESRRKAFAEDEVLQENIIFRLTKGARQPAQVCISSSEGPAAAGISRRMVPFTEVVAPDDRQRFIRLPVTVEGSELAARVRALPATLRYLGLTVSTGRVVDFRAREHLRKEPGSDTVPLIYPMHFNGGFVHWPKTNGRKANALAFNADTLDLVVPRGTYVLTKRFTSKEERRRIVAVIYDPQRIDAEHVGFENHLNYFHEDGHGLPPTLARGLAAFLNSTAVDEFFRQFSGHTQVNATDLRNMHYPERSQLEELGAAIGDFMPDQATIDAMVEVLI
jgi:adenine-specific DNA-methyltransferase